GEGATREDHVSLHVAHAFAFFADVTGDEPFRREHAWPVISGVADWIVSRVTARADGRYDWLQVGGAAERAQAIDNDALTNMLAVDILRRALALAAELEFAPPRLWAKVADGLK